MWPYPLYCYIVKRERITRVILVTFLYTTPDDYICLYKVSPNPNKTIHKQIKKEKVKWLHTYLRAHMYGYSQTMVTSQTADSWWDTPPNRKHSSATSSPGPTGQHRFNFTQSFSNLLTVVHHEDNCSQWINVNHLFAELEINRFAVAPHTV